MWLLPEGLLGSVVKMALLVNSKSLETVNPPEGGVMVVPPSESAALSEKRALLKLAVHELSMS